jgi:hypothetical protein
LSGKSIAAFLGFRRDPRCNGTRPFGRMTERHTVWRRAEPGVIALGSVAPFNVGSERAMLTALFGPTKFAYA